MIAPDQSFSPTSEKRSAAHSARLDHARKVLEETAEPPFQGRAQLIADRAKLRAALEVMVAWAEELSDPRRHIQPSTES